MLYRRKSFAFVRKSFVHTYELLGEFCNTAENTVNLKDIFYQTMNKKILRFLLSAVLLMCCMVANAAGTIPSKGNGSTGDPYQIATKEHLLWFADYVN